MNKTKVLNDYLGYKEIGIKSKRKLTDLKFLMNKFLNSSKKDISNFTEKDLIDYLNLISEDYSVNTLNGIKANIKNFIKWYFLDWSSRFRNLETLCRQQKAPATYQPEQMLSKEDIQNLVQNEHSLFWKTYFLVLFYSGSRPCEICSLKWDQIDFEDKGAFIKIYSEKNKEFFNKFVLEDVSFYLKKLQGNNSKYVFPSPQLKNKPISVKGVYWRFRELTKKVLGKQINPYILRHSIATILYNDNSIIDKNDVARQMGHSINMEKTYSNLSKAKQRERARKIWINPELKPEEKDKIKLLEQVVKSLRRGLAQIFLEVTGKKVVKIDSEGNFLIEKIKH